MPRNKLTDDNFNASRIGNNPFLRDLRVYAREVADTQDLLQVDKKDGVAVAVGGKLSLERVFNVEQTAFTKLFREGSKRKSVAAMPDRGKSLMIWLMYSIPSGSDYVVMNISRYLGESKCSHSTYLRAVDDLCAADVLCRTRYSVVFWLNPAYFFCGNRLDRFKEEVVVT